MTFATALREERTTQGLSQRELARLMDIDASWVAQIERGDVTPVGHTARARFDLGLGLAPGTLARRAQQFAQERAEVANLRRQVQYLEQVNAELRADVAAQDRQIGRLTRKRG